MARAPVSPITLNGFTANPPNGVIVQYQSFNTFVTGYIASSASFGGAPGVGITVFESAGRAYIAFFRMDGANARIGFQYSTSDGTAIAGVDYTAVSGTVMWEAFDISTKVVQVPILRTSSITSSIFNFNVTPIGGAFFGFPTAYHFRGGNLFPFPGPSYTVSPYSFPVTIQREGPGTLQFVGTPYSVQRPGGSTTVTLQVQRFNGFKGAVGCSFHTTDGTALAGVAYTAQTGTLSWTDGQGGTKNITITILSGGAGTQSFTVTIDTPTGGVAIGSVNIATVNIVAAAPPANPVSRSSIPEQLYTMFLPNDSSGEAYLALFWSKHFILQDAFSAYWRNNITMNTFLANKIGSFIGFGPGGSFGGTGDFFDGTDSFTPLTVQQKFQGLMY